MSTENQYDPEVAHTGEPFDWEKRLAELEAQGIVSRSTGPLENLWNMPQLPPGALERFLEREYRDFPRREQGGEQE